MFYVILTIVCFYIMGPLGLIIPAVLGTAHLLISDAIDTHNRRKVLKAKEVFNTPPSLTVVKSNNPISYN